MAESPSLAASIIAANRLTGSVINICYEYQLCSSRNVSVDLKPTIDYLRSLSDVLHNIYSMAVDGTDSTGHPRSSPILDLLVQSTTQLYALERVLETENWPPSEADLNNILNNLQTIKAALDVNRSTIPGDVEVLRDNIMTYTNTHHSTYNAGRDQYNYFTSSNGHAIDDLRQKIHHWLSAPDPSSNHNNACKKRQRTTGAWFLDGDEFKLWKSGMDSFIWLHGIPGSGKSILCSTIIEDVWRHCQSDPSFAIAYFYFDFGDTEKQRGDNLIRSLITQLSSQNTGCPKPLAALYLQNQDGQRQPTTEGLMITLKGIIEGFQQVYMILDGLDECHDREQLLLLIQEITEWKLGRLHILAASREERDIEDCVGPRASAWIKLHSARVNTDIECHIRETLRNDTKFKKWPMNIQEQIEAALIGGAHGMFRWVVCQLDVLRKCIKLSSLQKALRSLPKTLDETYDHILQSIDDEYRDDAFKVLQWLAFSARPITLAEVVEALAVDFGNNKAQFDPDQRMPDPRDILLICSSLVTTSSPTFAMDNVTEGDIKDRKQEN